MDQREVRTERVYPVIELFYLLPCFIVEEFESSLVSLAVAASEIEETRFMQGEYDVHLHTCQSN